MLCRVDVCFPMFERLQYLLSVGKELASYPRRLEISVNFAVKTSDATLTSIKAPNIHISCSKTVSNLFECHKVCRVKSRIYCFHYRAKKKKQPRLRILRILHITCEALFQSLKSDTQLQFGMLS
jgi:hypothetical protein